MQSEILHLLEIFIGRFRSAFNRDNDMDFLITFSENNSEVAFSNSECIVSIFQLSDIQTLQIII